MKSKISFFLLALFLCLNFVSAKSFNENEIASDERVAKYFNSNEYDLVTDEVYEVLTDEIDEATTDIIYVESIYLPEGILLKHNVLSEEEFFSRYKKSMQEVSTYALHPIEQTTYKRLKIDYTRVGTKKYKLSLTNTWLKMPNRRSFDVMGIQWSASFDPDWNSYSGKQTSNVGTTNYTASSSPGYFKEYSHAITLAMNLYNSATSLTNYLEITGTCNGTININGSYQHATKDISLANLNSNYGLNANGLGGMFDFWGAASGVYDGMAGVNTSFTCN